MSATPRQLSADEMRLALLRQFAEQAPAAGHRTGARSRRAPVYARCHRCRDRQPCLWTFDRPDAWQGALSHPSVVQTAVQSLRRQIGRRAVLLCDACVIELDVPPASQPHQLGFEV